MARDRLSVRKAAQHFGVCTRTIQSWKKSTEHTIYPGYGTKISKAQILKDVEQYPEDYLSERAVRFGVSVHVVFTALHAIGMSDKKKC